MDVGAAAGHIAQTRFIPLLAESGLSDSQILLIIVAVGVSATMIVSARRRRPRDANSPRAYVREQLARLGQEAEVKDDLEALLVQVQDVTRQMNAQLDTRFCKLERIIRDADERIDKLDRLSRVVEGQPVCDVTVGDRAEETAACPQDHASNDQTRRHAQIYELSDAGLSTVEIAEQSDRTTGEIELILALRPKSSTTANR